ncbi:MAG: hypothetical protein CTY19_05345 [Methylomonas sp.]|nr:MAG: hypothetical protein CTY19_05345 [Methylomonas sp.]
MAEVENAERQYKVLVFGLERKNLPIPSEPLKSQNFSIFFEKFGAACRFQEFDGVILFQGIFENFERKSDGYKYYTKHAYDADELDKRKKEAALLLRQGGFLCFLLTDPFFDRDDRKDFSATDLAKYHLNYSDFYRKNFRDRIAHVTPVFDEFKRFLDVFGAANSYFDNLNEALNCRDLARVGNQTVGLLIEQSEYFLPSLVPDGRIDVINEYFHLLADAITSIHNKLHQTVPDWVAAYEFQEEQALFEERTALINRVTDIDQRLAQLTQYKASLVHSGPQLVADVSTILKAVLGVDIDATDDFREDIKFMDDDNNVIGVCEIKGINRGVKRENINQTDSHRERSGFDATFPALLIVNTGIKSARSIEEKDLEVAAEQVKHAAHMRVLIMRTLDLLGLLRLALAGKLTTQEARSLVLLNVGWIRVQSENIQVLPANEK